MPADVIQKINELADVNYGSVSVATGAKSELATQTNEDRAIQYNDIDDVLYDRLNNRLDDTQYYTA